LIRSLSAAAFENPQPLGGPGPISWRSERGEARHLERLGAVGTEIEATAAAELAAARPGRTFAISNEVGLGLVPDNPLGRDYRDLLGRVNAVWAAAAALIAALTGKQQARSPGGAPGSTTRRWC
jgi:hypothetical protein